MVNCDLEYKKIKGIKYVAPFFTIFVVLFGIVLAFILFFLGIFNSKIKKINNSMISFLLRFKDINDVIVKGIFISKMRCILTSQSFRISPRIAGFIYKRFNMMLVILLTFIFATLVTAIFVLR